MGKWMLKGCLRCGGDILADADEDGWYAKCIQCSYRIELNNIDRFDKESTQSNEEKQKS
ncbi:hypothetical protein ACFLTP_04465 [Chloroflexota bacterium]